MEVRHTAERIDETGNRYGKLVVIGYAGTNGHNALWNCQCDCGKTCKRLGIYLRAGKVMSCGCYHSEQLRNRNTKYPGVPKRLRHIWYGMLSRCEDEKTKYYCNYGGRGIQVCEEWHDLISFAKWALENGYRDDLSIERIDNDGNYSPQNCKWATKKEQESNKRSNRWVVINGERKTVTQWCEVLNMPKATVRSRIFHGVDPFVALTKPIDKRYSRKKR